MNFKHPAFICVEDRNFEQVCRQLRHSAGVTQPGIGTPIRNEMLYLALEAEMRHLDLQEYDAMGFYEPLPDEMDDC